MISTPRDLIQSISATELTDVIEEHERLLQELEDVRRGVMEIGELYTEWLDRHIP